MSLLAPRIPHRSRHWKLKYTTCKVCHLDFQMVLRDEGKSGARLSLGLAAGLPGPYANRWIDTDPWFISFSFPYHLASSINNDKSGRYWLWIQAFGYRHDKSRQLILWVSGPACSREIVSEESSWKEDMFLELVTGSGIWFPNAVSFNTQYVLCLVSSIFDTQYLLGLVSSIVWYSVCFMFGIRVWFWYLIFFM